MSLIEIRDLRKHYGRIQALRGVSLTVGREEIFGLLGQNGAGKTTLIKILLGIALRWQGQASLLGNPAGAVHVRKKIGYLPEDHRFPSYHTGNSLLEFYGRLLGVPRRDRKQRIDAMLSMVGLASRKHYKIRTYSKGMKQRLGIAQALFHDPEVIFLDEPTDGVDPVGRREIRQMLQDLRNAGKTIFINSHLLGEVELVCDRVAILHKGLLIREGDTAALTQVRGLYVIGLAPNEELPVDELRSRGYSAQRNGIYWELELSNGQSIDEVVDLLRSRKLGLRHLVEKRITLEDMFLKTVAGETRPVATIAT